MSSRKASGKETLLVNGSPVDGFREHSYTPEGGSLLRSDPCPAQPHRTVSAHGDSLGATLCCIPLYAEEDALAHLIAQAGCVGRHVARCALGWLDVACAGGTYLSGRALLLLFLGDSFRE